MQPHLCGWVPGETWGQRCWCCPGLVLHSGCLLSALGLALPLCTGSDASRRQNATQMYMEAVETYLICVLVSDPEQLPPNPPCHSPSARCLLVFNMTRFSPRAAPGASRVPPSSAHKSRLFFLSREGPRQQRDKIPSAPSTSAQHPSPAPLPPQPSPIPHLDPNRDRDWEQGSKKKPRSPLKAAGRGRPGPRRVSEARSHARSRPGAAARRGAGPGPEAAAQRRQRGRGRERPQPALPCPVLPCFGLPRPAWRVSEGIPRLGAVGEREGRRGRKGRAVRGGELGVPAA